MAIHIKNAEVERIIRELAERTGEPLANAVRIAAKERLERLEAEKAATTDTQVTRAQIAATKRLI